MYWSIILFIKVFFNSSNIKSVVIACVLASFSILYSIFSFDAILRLVIIITFGLWVAFLVLPLCFNGRIRLVVSILVSILYFINNLSYFSFGGPLSEGAFASIMESNAKESIGYIQEFGVAPLFFSIVIQVFYVFFLKKNKMSPKPILFAFFSFVILFGHLALFKSIVSERWLTQFKSYPYSAISPVLTFSPLSPIGRYLEYREEASLLSLPYSMKLPNNVKKGGLSKYDNIYLILGESVSGRNFSKNHPKNNTTPFFDRMLLNENFHWVRKAISPTPITRESLKRVLTFATAKHANDYFDKINLIDAANEKGFSTYWISTQPKAGVHNTTTYRTSLSSKYENFEVNDDLDVPIELQKISSSEDKRFIISHLSGSHAPYVNYIESDYLDLNEKGNVNARYDATIRKTDRILKSIIDSLPKNTLLIYLSDHGEVVGLGHGLTVPSKDQFDIPFFVYDNSGRIDDIKSVINHYSRDGYFNSQRVMELVMTSLGYSVDLDSNNDVFDVLFSNGKIYDYRELRDDFPRLQ